MEWMFLQIVSRHQAQQSDGVITLAVSVTGTGTMTGTRTMVSAPVPVQVQCERFYIKPHNPFVHVSVLAPETASVIKP